MQKYLPFICLCY